MDNIDKLLHIINSCSNPHLVLNTLAAVAEPVINQRNDVCEEGQIGVGQAVRAAVEDMQRP